MPNKIIVEVACPNCQNPIDVREHGRHVQCDACHSQFILQGRLCPNCHAYHQHNEAICGQCGTNLTRICRKCLVENWSGDEYCNSCGSVLDILDYLAEENKITMADIRQTHHEKVRFIKEQTKNASEARMSAFMAEEMARRSQIVERKEKQRTKDMLGFLLIGLLILIIILGFVLYLLPTT